MKINEEKIVSYFLIKSNYCEKFQSYLLIGRPISAMSFTKTRATCNQFNVVSFISQIL